MKKNILLLGIILVALMSCTTMKKSIPTAPLNTLININMSDLDYIGEASGTSSQYYVLGIPYGGRKYKRGVTQSQFNMRFPINRGINNAMYDALMSKPDADFILPLTFETTTTHSFLGRHETLKLRAKAFKIKVK